MLKKALVVLFLGILAFGWMRRDAIFKKTSSPQTKTTAVSTSRAPVQTTAILKNNIKKSTSIFIPYWSLPVFNISDVTSYDRLIYFGITATKSGVNTSDAGYAGLSQYAQAARGKNSYLTLRMLDDNVNEVVLSNPAFQETIIQDTVDLAKKHNFNGVVLDLEFVAGLDEKIPGQINDFAKAFYSAAKKQHLKLAVAVYGDNFYRKRPFDVSYLAKNSDEIIIMAYDLHKSRGEPGPNFPMGGKDTFGYDFAQMIADFSNASPKGQLTITYGMFGYDWKVDEEKRPLKAAKALSLKDIKKEFLGNCQWKNCLVNRDKDAAETEVDYVEEPYQLHIVWFEDEESVKVKTDYLQHQGIGNTAYWVYGYF